MKQQRRTPANAVNEHCDAVERMIYVLLSKVKEARKTADQATWGDAGSMGHVREVLHQLMEFYGIDIAFTEQHGHTIQALTANPLFAIISDDKLVQNMHDSDQGKFVLAFSADKLSFLKNITGGEVIRVDLVRA